jgi:uncharacterized membrane-anchored protein YhcB (DUF1043 family)
MNVKVKAAIILIITLVIGMILGAMFNRAITQKRIRDFLAMRTQYAFAARFEKIIGPDETQKEEVRKIIDKYAKMFNENAERNHQEMTTLFRSFRDELRTILSPEQIKKLRRGFFRPRPFPDKGKFPRGRRGKPTPEVDESI